MIITKIQIKNYRSLQDITLDNLKSLNVFIGKNGSGKSHIIEALELFFADLNMMQQAEKGFEENLWFDRENREPITFRIQLNLTDKQKKEIFNEDILKAMGLQADSVSKSNELTIEREISGNRWNNKIILLGDWEMVRDNNILKEFPQNVFVSKKIQSLSDYGKNEKNKIVESEENISEGAKTINQGFNLLPISPETAQKILNKMTALIKEKFKLIRTTRESGERSSPGTRPFLIDPETRNHLTAIGQNPAREESRIWAGWQRFFQKFSSYSLEMRGGAVHAKLNDLYLPLNSLGGGDQEILILERQLSDSAVIYGIEEPETHLHAEYQRQLLNKLKAKSKDSQMFITTHSPILIDRIDLDNSTVWLVTKEKKATKIESVNFGNNQNLKDILSELGVRMSDVFFADSLLFVEGSTEKEIIPLIAEKLKIDLNQRGIEIIAMRGKDTGKYHIKMWSHIAKNTQLPVFYLFDGDATKEIKEAQEEGFLTDENHYLMEVDDIEDLYPEDILRKAIKSTITSIEIEKEDLSPPRKEKLNKIFKENKINDWKVSLGKRVISEMTEEQIKDTMNEIKEVFDKLIK